MKQDMSWRGARKTRIFTLVCFACWCPPRRISLCHNLRQYAYMFSTSGLFLWSFLHICCYDPNVPLLLSLLSPLLLPLLLMLCLLLLLRYCGSREPTPPLLETSQDLDHQKNALSKHVLTIGSVKSIMGSMWLVEEPRSVFADFHCKFVVIVVAVGVVVAIAVIVRPEKWDDSQVGFQDSNVSGGRIVFLPGGGRILGARCFQNGQFGRISSTLSFTVSQGLGGHASGGACRSSRASARCIVLCRGLCASSPPPQIPRAPAPTLGGFRHQCSALGFLVFLSFAMACWASRLLRSQQHRQTLTKKRRNRWRWQTSWPWLTFKLRERR